MKESAVVDWTIPDPKLPIPSGGKLARKETIFIRWNKISLWRMRQQSHITYKWYKPINGTNLL